jgi:hypothetical protein
MEKHIYFLTIVLVILVSFFIFRYLSNDYLAYKKLNPYLVEHTKRIGIGNNKINSNLIRRSIDQHHGMEFTYAFWLKIDVINDSNLHNILSKGDPDLPCPGIFVKKNSDDNTIDLQVDISVFQNKPDCDKYSDKNKCIKKFCKWNDNDKTCTPYNCGDNSIPLDCSTPDGETPCCPQLSRYCNTIINEDTPRCENKLKETCIVNNLPIQKWTHVIVMLVGNYLDVFINGSLYDRFEIKGVPKQNTSDLIIGAEGNKIVSANGSIMRLQYFNYAIPASKINQIVSKTEITKDISKELEHESTTDYLDRNYWIGENVDSNKRMF